MPGSLYSIQRGQNFNQQEYHRANWKVAGVECKFEEIPQQLQAAYGETVASELCHQLFRTYTQEIQKFASEKFFYKKESPWFVKVEEGAFTIELRNNTKSKNPQLVYHVELNEISLINIEEISQGKGIYTITQPTISYDCVVDTRSLETDKPLVNYLAESMLPKKITTAEGHTLSEKGVVTVPTTSVATKMLANLFKPKKPKEAVTKTKEDVHSFLPTESSKEYKELTNLIDQVVGIAQTDQKKEDAELLLINAALELCSSVSRSKVDKANELLEKYSKTDQVRECVKKIIKHAEETLDAAQKPVHRLSRGSQNPT
ncbi:MAG TPA: hypothetical protein VLI69_04030 [Gammaproteobacteria bacterium]|nr:hypothetical protein [Gammaproteobacteria bacterium]